MLNKNQMIIAAVAVAAVFSVYRLGLFLDKLAGTGPELNQESKLPPADQDPDRDGLSNNEESLWNTDPTNPDTDRDGFKDGEEVDSGHNPLVPGPNDSLNEGNLTDAFSQLVASGLYAGALNPASSSYAQTLGSITDSVADSAKFSLTKPVDISGLTVVKSDKSADTAYLLKFIALAREFGRILDSQYRNTETMLNLIGSEGFENQKVRGFYSNQADTAARLFDQASATVIPKNFKDSHIKLLNLIHRVRLANTTVVEGTKDPIKAAVALNLLGNAYTDLVELLTVYADIAEEREIDLMKLLNEAR
ncbi:MAG: hypothetical protein A3C88_00710 [Candidatus Yanofskybacteria bacterium RIFCSPHIGHO2_02_FULL_50_12]|uniref:Uncharacterized protein n=1 Tax=Candidatus Yanofskybacteria bacterium RIFCSPHIGHO2_02_FULL_50_12 TaxID=1802685 RepID=A0A1F8FVG5_9BACT|nr:MAG: hypothetical protein A3C88_00710 [Candidatus Yanofskybacteria bacterium RIFCSPHIGHO2_02_FULL_50_12]